MVKRSEARDGRVDSVVKIFTVVAKPDYYRPWVLGYHEESGGSGCILPGHRILTNAHVVSDQVYVQVLRAGGTRRYDARVAFVDHESELALLEVADQSFFEGSTPARIGKLPSRQARVSVYGFPLGGDQLSITEGIVSRIEVRRYTHSHRELLSVQTDAAINPGNSGGPVFEEDDVVGVAFESYAGQGLENTGYFVPTPIIEHFLEDVADGRCDGVPALGLVLQRLDSPALRAWCGLKEGETGLLINHVVPDSACDGALQARDVLVSVDGVAIANDGSVSLRQGDRVSCSYLVSRRHVGDELKLGIKRKGRAKTLAVKVRPPLQLVAAPAYDRRPSFFFFGGLLFTPLSHNYLSTWEPNQVDPRFRVWAEHALRSRQQHEVVLLSHVFAHEMNVGFHGFRNGMVAKVNGRKVRALRDVVKAVARPQGRFHVFELSSTAEAPPRSHVVLEAARVQAATAELMQRYDIPRDRSADLPA